MDDSDSSLGEDERTQKPLGKSSFDSSSQSGPNQSRAADPYFAEQLDGKELRYEVAARSRADGVASITTQKKKSAVY